MARRLGGRGAKADPLEQFELWLAEAERARLPWAEAATLATAARSAAPSARAVMLRGFDARGFVFYTDYGSRKARELAANRRAALVFLWAPFERQVRVEGEVAKVTAAESDVYFASRPRGSRLAAVASYQSEVIRGRKVLERRMRDLRRRFRGGSVPRPSRWGGYRLTPRVLEFWQGRANRLHDRLRYTRLADGGWRLERLSP